MRLPGPPIKPAAPGAPSKAACRQRLKEQAAKGAFSGGAADEARGKERAPAEGPAGEEAKGAPKFPQEGAKPDCDEWPNPCEPE
ncbi:hypothetical protein C2E21_8008 [Chlorella sorokiniana]|uniref:Uncharacterized protein n=1 Tax=Chlorella sorokiniana TaxID=3076 RepID=A0A2P6TFT3_CHLSO|nr:hypothetical protein C2E21_8008 [Chlorella sorokiniana]|eukprot:PRW32965.1 hypothetical protein C2E21_8008 [Chlorella sorokiniana]